MKVSLNYFYFKEQQFENLYCGIYLNTTNNTYELPHFFSLHLKLIFLSEYLIVIFVKCGIRFSNFDT